MNGAERNLDLITPCLSFAQSYPDGSKLSVRIKMIVDDSTFEVFRRGHA